CQREFLAGPAVDVVEDRPRDQPAPHGAQVIDVVARPQPSARRVKLDWLHLDQLANLRWPHVRDDNPASGHGNAPPPRAPRLWNPRCQRGENVAGEAGVAAAEPQTARLATVTGGRC